MPDAERLTEPLAHHGEGPFWDAPGKRLIFCDVLAGEIVAINALGEITRHTVPSPVATTIRRRASGGLVVAVEHGLVAANDELSGFTPLVALPAGPDCRTNDGGCDPMGGFVIGTMAYDERPSGGALYRVAPDRSVTELLAGVSISNGVQWSSDGASAYYVDSPTRTVAAFDVDPDTGAWSNGRTHIDIVDTDGFPDGMAIDEEGGLWVALWGGGAINHYDGSGRLIQSIRVPGVSQPSSCTFGGTERNTLFITTSRQGLPEDAEPDAGAVFALDTEFRGAVPWDFAG